MRKLLIVAMMVLPVVAAGCSRGPAEAALKAADEAITRVTPEAGKYVPAELKELTGIAADAKAKFAAGDYAGALARAKDLPAKAAELAQAADTKKSEFAANWKEFQRSVPATMRALGDRISAVEAMKKLPKGFDTSLVTSAKASLADVSAGWAAASDSFANGDFAAAFAKAADVRAKVEALAGRVDALPAPAAR
jgi:hypothetical protein